MESVNPATGETIERWDDHDDDEVGRRLDAAVRAFPAWRERSFDERAAVLRAVARRLEQEREEYARLMAREMGKPVAEGRSEAEKCAWVCDYYADRAETFLAPEGVATDASTSFVRYDPLGPVLAVMPWNFPFWQVFRFAAPSLMAGNVGLLKHASNVTGCALAIERMFADAGAPEGVFTALLIGSDRVADVIAHDAVRAVTLTGSDRAGRSVAAAAGESLKKTVLELGGSDPFVVLGDVDPEATAEKAAEARTINSGQSCIAAKRFIVADEIAATFERALAERMDALVVGDPLDDETDVGPMAREDLLEDLHDQVERSLDAGARRVTGGRRLDRRGFFYAPTVLGDVRPGMAAFDEETFGPVAALVTAADTDEAIELANRSRYGLGASIWTGDAGQGADLAARVEAGNVFVNGVVKSDPRLPFGGVKDSGYGRELATNGIREFVNVKTVWVR